VKTKVYLEIDALFDTRYPIVKRHTLTDDKEYLTRQSDNFKGLGYKAFMELYKVRNRSIFSKATTTPIIKVLIETLLLIKAELLRDNSKEIVEVDLNIYPYYFSQFERDILKKVLKELLKNRYGVNIINSEFKCKYLSVYDSIITYDGMEYIDLAIRECDLYNDAKPSTTIITPSLVVDESNIKDIEQFLNSTMHTLAPFIDLQFVHITNFCNHKLLFPK
jgi:hypothetical protein